MQQPDESFGLQQPEEFLSLQQLQSQGHSFLQQQEESQGHFLLQQKSFFKLTRPARPMIEYITLAAVVVFPLQSKATKSNWKNPQRPQFKAPITAKAKAIHPTHLHFIKFPLIMKKFN